MVGQCSNGGMDSDKYRRYCRIVAPAHTQPRHQHNHTTWRACYQGSLLTTAACIVITAVSYLLFTFHHRQHLEMTTEEARLLHPNTHLYSYVEVLDRASKINTFYYSSEPPLTRTAHIESNETLCLEEGSFRYWARYLNQGSLVEVAWTMDNSVSFYVIQSASNLQQWMVQPAKHFESMDTAAKGRKKLVVKQADDFYFVLDNQDGVAVCGSVYFTILASRFDTTKANGFFTGNFRMDFPFGVPQWLVLDNPSKDHSYTISITHHSRIPMLMLGGILLEVLCLCLCLVLKVVFKPSWVTVYPGGRVHDAEQGRTAANKAM